MEDESMKRALGSRRGRGIDVSIILGQPIEDMPVEQPQMVDEEEQQKRSDLAPPPDRPLERDMPGGVSLSGLQDSDLLSGMTEYDQNRAKSAAPRSLAERARREMLLKK